MKIIIGEATLFLFLPNKLLMHGETYPAAAGDPARRSRILFSMGRFYLVDVYACTSCFRAGATVDTEMVLLKGKLVLITPDVDFVLATPYSVSPDRCFCPHRFNQRVEADL